MKSIKSAKIFAILLTLVMVLSFSTLLVSAAQPDVIVDYVKGATSDNKEGPNGFFGPYTGKVGEEKHAVLDENDGLVFNTALKDAYFTSEVNPQEMGMRKYAIIVIKTDNPTGIEGFTFTIGGAGKPWNQFKGADGKEVPALTTDWQTICIDLEASLGITSIPSDEGTGADIAMNQGVASEGKISVKTITFTDNAPDGVEVASNDTTEANDDTTAANNDITVAPTTAAASSSGISVGLIIGIIAAVVVVIVVVLVLVLKK